MPLDHTNTLDMGGNPLTIASLGYIVDILNDKGEIHILNVGRSSLLTLGLAMMAEYQKFLKNQ